MATKEASKTKESKREKKETAQLKASDYARSSDIPYHKITVSCACGAEFKAGSTLESIRVDICSQCHPFFTGENRIVDAEGRVEQFRKRFKLQAK